MAITSEQYHPGHLEITMLPPQLEKEIELLRERYTVDVTEEESIIDVVIHNFETSDLYKNPKTNILLRIPRAYPDAGLDMFWTDEDLILKDGGIPNGANVVEQYLGKKWRRFSWHPQPGNPSRWNPNVDNLISYLQFVSKRFSQR